MIWWTIYIAIEKSLRRKSLKLKKKTNGILKSKIVFENWYNVVWPQLQDCKKKIFYVNCFILESKSKYYKFHYLVSLRHRNLMITKSHGFLKKFLIDAITVRLNPDIIEYGKIQLTCPIIRFPSPEMIIVCIHTYNNIAGIYSQPKFISKPDFQIMYVFNKRRRQYNTFVIFFFFASNNIQ